MAKLDPLGPLYSLLEQRTAEKFIDEALNIPANAAHVLYVATANTTETIPKPILSRFIVLHIQAMNAEQHQYVTQSIFTTLLNQHNCAGFFRPQLLNSVVEALRNQSPRIIKATLRRALAQAAMRDPKAQKITIFKKDLLFSEPEEMKPGLYDGNPPFGFCIND